MNEEEISRNMDDLILKPCDDFQENLKMNGITLVQPERKKRQVQKRDKEVQKFVFHDPDEFRRNDVDLTNKFKTIDD